MRAINGQLLRAGCAINRVVGSGNIRFQIRFVLLVTLNPPPPQPKVVVVLQTPLLVLIGYLFLPLPLEPLEELCSIPDPSDDLLLSLPALPDDSWLLPEALLAPLDES